MIRGLGLVDLNIYENTDVRCRELLDGALLVAVHYGLYRDFYITSN